MMQEAKCGMQEAKHRMQEAQSDAPIKLYLTLILQNITIFFSGIIS